MKMTTIVITSLALVCMVMMVRCGGSGSSGPSASDPAVSDDNTRMEAGGAGTMLGHGTELSTGFGGLALDNVYIVDGDDKKISTSQVALNSKFSIVYEGVKNYTLKDGRAFPSLSIHVIDNNQSTVISEADLFASYADGFTVADASVLRATITVGDPMKPGKYICTVQVVDKNNSNAAIISTWEFEVK